MRTVDSNNCGLVVGVDFARTLERELSASHAECQRLRAAAKRAVYHFEGQEYLDALAVLRAALQEMTP